MIPITYIMYTYILCFSPARSFELPSNKCPWFTDCHICVVWLLRPRQLWGRDAGSGALPPLFVIEIRSLCCKIISYTTGIFDVKGHKKIILWINNCCFFQSSKYWKFIRREIVIHIIIVVGYLNEKIYFFQEMEIC